ncbi:hypothetical protein LEP1GSC045_1887 [Leptospira interrogans serovar Pomona str. Kennewicki LC82-25]|nr:hypothetical protein LEP1GSC045_1887 [Leptospira interrogans serovar Pomona str. Kennewicki LC82-25]EKR27580.1 hypothetical protein LEP1GSC087_2621 [Leptospira interrogans serovar Bataviae str. L1111]EMN78170.1 hypothetical protein LEP1GSC102_1606 [Leptospira interrogans str. UI 09600]EMN99166.1 hypothetical protein LEP1GSC112_1883 [Leptospira interrogans serovar Pomona str. UT364]
MKRRFKNLSKKSKMWELLQLLKNFRKMIFKRNQDDLINSI